MGRMLVCGSKISPAVVRSPPVMAITILHWTIRNQLVMATKPLEVLEPSALCTLVYYTSAPHENLGMATVL